MILRWPALALGAAAIAAALALVPSARAAALGGPGADCAEMWRAGRLPTPAAAEGCTEELRRLAREYRQGLDDLARRYPGDMAWLPGESRITAMTPAELLAFRARGDALERLLPERARLEARILDGAPGGDPEALARYRQLLRAELVLDMAAASRPADGIESFLARQAARPAPAPLAGIVEEVAREAREHVAAAGRAKFDPTLHGFVWLARMPDGLLDPREPGRRDDPRRPDDDAPPLGDPIAFGQPAEVVFPIPGEGVCPVEPGPQDGLALGPPDDATPGEDEEPPLGDGFTLGQPPSVVFPVPGDGGVCPIEPRDGFPPPPIDLVLNGYGLHGAAITQAPRDPATQLVIASVPPMALGGAPPSEGAARSAPEPVPGGGSSTADADPLLRIYVTSLGHLGSGGVEVTLVAPDPAAIAGETVVLEPVTLTREATERLLAERREAAREGGEETAAADAYCVEIEREPPAKGTYLRVAPPHVQQRYEPQRRVLEAAGRARDAGRLVPDSDPESYFHSIRQWSVWALAEAFDRTRFEEAFVEHTKRNFAESDRSWTPEIERALRGLAPQRWRDIQTILELAHRMEKREENQPEGGAP